jgi:hypothetical protein
MKPRVWTFCLGLIYIFGAAGCQPTPFSPAPHFLACSDQGITSGELFVQKKVKFGSPDFNPQATPNLPPRGTRLYPTQPYSTDLAAAFEAAPSFFQDDLCGLTVVLVVQNTCRNISCTLDVINNSYGFRVYPSSEQVRYIAISQQLWQSGQAPLLTDFETRRLQQLLNWTSATKSSIPPPVFDKANPNTSQMSVLAALAHEFGHVYWWDVFVQPPGASTLDMGRPTSCNRVFYSESWQNPLTIPPHRYVDFGDVSDNYHEHDVANMVEFFRDLLIGDFADLGDLLHEIYSGQLPDKPNTNSNRWASALAAYSTDEDFVESFQLYVLLNAKPYLQSLQIRISGNETYTDDIPASVTKTSVLGRKLQCFGPFPEHLRPL